MHYLFTWLLTISLPLQTLAAMLPPVCHDDPTGVEVSYAHNSTPTASDVDQLNAGAHKPHQSQVKLTIHSHSKHSHTNEHQKPTKAVVHVGSKMFDTQYPSLCADKPGHSSSGTDSSCQHCAPCCLGFAVLPTFSGFNSPDLVQSKPQWTAPVLLAIAPRLFERPPKPVTA